MIEIPSINKRIKQIVDEFTNGNVQKFVELVGIKNHQNLNRIFNIDKRNNKYPNPSAEILNCIKISLPQVNYDWLLTGEGNMLSEELPMENWERVNFIMENEGMNKNSFSEAIGLSNNVTITRLINEKRTASPNTCKKIISRFPKYNLQWLLTGKGEILTTQGHENKSSELIIGSDVVTVPREAWNMIKMQIETIQSQQCTIEHLAKKAQSNTAQDI